MTGIEDLMIRGDPIMTWLVGHWRPLLSATFCSLGLIAIILIIAALTARPMD